MTNFLDDSRTSTGTFKKGLIPWNKGKKGVMPTPWNKGKKYPRVGKARCRENNPMYGKKHTEQAKKRIGKASKGNKYALGHFPMLEGSGIKLVDASGHGRTGSFRGSGEPAWSTDTAGISVLRPAASARGAVA